MSEKEYRKYCWKQISLPVMASEKLQTISDNFRYGKKLTRGKVIEAMSWQYNLIKNNNYAIVFRDGKFEVIENETR